MAKDSSSSSDEEDAKLREALDSQMFNVSESVQGTSKANERPKRSYKDNILNVTPEFQNFMAKRLYKLLDESIEEYTSEIPDEEIDLSGGIRLFRDSQRILTDKNYSDPHYEFNRYQRLELKKAKNRIVKAKNESESESELLENARSVAVSPEWILNKEGISGWSKPKGKEIRVKKISDKEFEVIESPFVSAPSIPTS